MCRGDQVKIWTLAGHDNRNKAHKLKVNMQRPVKFKLLQSCINL